MLRSTLLTACVIAYLSVIPAAAAEPVAPTDPEPMTFELADGVAMRLAPIPAGKFLRGTPVDKITRYRRNERPQMEVTLSRPFHMGVTEVTQAQWVAVMGTRPWEGRPYAGATADAAANYMSWAEAVEFCDHLSKRVGWIVTLPTEAQWAYAARAGAQTAFCYGDDPKLEQLDQYGWYVGNAGETRPHSVGGRQANIWGLHDMHGNVWEWCFDRYRHHYQFVDEQDPVGPGNGTGHIVRGGAFNSAGGDCDSRKRFYYFDVDRYYYGSVGFRVVATRPPSALPDPFLMNDGRRVATRADWAKRREEILEIVKTYSYGHTPPAPKNLTVTSEAEEDALDGLATRRRVELSMGPDLAVKLRVELLIPKRPDRPGPMPAIVRNIGRPQRRTGYDEIAREVVGRGFVLAEYVRSDLDPDKKDTIGAAQTAYPEYDWQTLAVWAWGGSRVIDYLLTLPGVHPDRIIATGHSRGGKTALLLGAFDKRVAICAPNAGGAGGSGCYRYNGPYCETLAYITTITAPHWFVPRLATFGNKEEQLPFDLHYVKALVAPRPLVNTNGLQDNWANPSGTQVTFEAAQKVYEFLGASENNLIHYRPGRHGHRLLDWIAVLDYADHRFFGTTLRRQYNNLPFRTPAGAIAWDGPPMPKR